MYYSAPTVPFAVGVPVRCSRDVGHEPSPAGRLVPVVWHAGSGIDLDGEPFGAAWREVLALPGSVP